jgi:hypothetical protein
MCGCPTFGQLSFSSSGHLQEKVFDRNDIDLAEQLSRECLRYMYRLLFLFYIEARPELGYVPINQSEVYLKGYSLVLDWRRLSV